MPKPPCLRTGLSSASQTGVTPQATASSACGSSPPHAVPAPQLRCGPSLCPPGPPQQHCCCRVRARSRLACCCCCSDRSLGGRCCCPASRGIDAEDRRVEHRCGFCADEVCRRAGVRQHGPSTVAQPGGAGGGGCRKSSSRSRREARTRAPPAAYMDRPHCMMLPAQLRRPPRHLSSSCGASSWSRALGLRAQLIQHLSRRRQLCSYKKCK